MALENGAETCTCPKGNCERHGKCAECLEHHKNHKKFPPYCKRERKPRSERRERARNRTKE